MTLHITADRIASSVSPHSATRTMATAADAIPGGATMWSVTWLNRRLTRNGAITAMTIVEEAEALKMGPGWLVDGEKWALVDSLAAELGLEGMRAAQLATAPLAPVRDTHAIPAGDEPAPVTSDDYAEAIAIIMERPSESPLTLAEVQQIARVLTAGQSTARTGTLPIYPAPGSTIPGMPGYVVGECEHRVAGSEWRAGFRVCERCPATAKYQPGQVYADRDGDYLIGVTTRDGIRLLPFYEDDLYDPAEVEENDGPLTLVEPERPVADLALPVSDADAKAADL